MRGFTYGSYTLCSILCVVYCCVCCSQVAYTQVLYTTDTEVYAFIVWMCTLIRLKGIVTERERARERERERERERARAISYESFLALFY